MSTTAIISILISAVSFFIGGWAGFSRIRKAKDSDKVTLVKGDKTITISSKLNEDDRRKLAHF